MLGFIGTLVALVGVALVLHKTLEFTLNKIWECKIRRLGEVL